MTSTDEAEIPPELAEKLRAGWVWLLVLGLVMTLGGAGALALPQIASLTVHLIFGVAILAGGVLHAIHAFQVEGWKARLWEGLIALLYIVGGVLLLAKPLVGIIALSLILIITIGAEGVARVVLAIAARPQPGWGWLAVGGVLAAGVSIYLLALWPAISVVFLGTMLGISMIFEGVGYIMLAMMARRLGT